MSQRSELTNSKRWVIKIGSALLTNDGRAIDHVRIENWVEQIAWLCQQGIEVVLVSSGAVAAGMNLLKWAKRPEEMELLQAAAAVGQANLIQHYQGYFAKYGIQTAQILLTHDDLSDRTRYLNARRALKALINLQTMPIINENDTVVTDEIRFGDNDTLGALVANLLEADTLVILTDQNGLYDSDPRNNPNAQLISRGCATNPEFVKMASGAGALGRGGMSTKIRAAKLAARSGANTVIVGGRIDNVLKQVYQGNEVGTLLTAPEAPITARKQWLAGHLQTKGTLVIDQGAEKAISKDGKSLLPVGIKSVIGQFRAGEAVDCINIDGQLIARGLANYDYKDTQKIIGKPSKAIVEILGYSNDVEIVHRDNMVVF